MEQTPWIVFLVIYVALLFTDLIVLNRQHKAMSISQANKWALVWIAIGMSFGLVVYFFARQGDLETTSGQTALFQYWSGYLIELALSFDNVFVMLVILRYFKIPQDYYHRVLFWGIAGAIIFRGLLIGAGLWLVHLFEWVNYIFAAIILYTAYGMLKPQDESIRMEENRTVLFLKRLFPITKGHYDHHFFIRRMNITAATPLFIALIVIEITDILFAFDSIPAVLAISRDPYVVFASNLFAVLGLRALFFVVANLIQSFYYLHYSLVFILVFIAVKLIGNQWIHLPEWLSLGIILVALAIGILYSKYKERTGPPPEH